REMTFALATSANRRLGANDSQAAIDDVLACHRMARLVSHGGDTLDLLVAVSLHRLANAATSRLLTHGNLTLEQCRDLQRQLAELPAFMRTEETFDYASRYFDLAVVREISSNGLDYLFDFIYSFDLSALDL